MEQKQALRIIKDAQENKEQVQSYPMHRCGEEGREEEGEEKTKFANYAANYGNLPMN